MTFYHWSQTAANNGSADATCPFPEGMAPSAVNDGTRGMMAAAAKYRDDIAGAIVTGGTSSSYTLSSYQVFDSLAHMDGKMIAFVPHATNTVTTSLNVDGLGARGITTSSAGTLVTAGTLIQGTPYTATFDNTGGQWILHNFYGNPFNIPLGACLEYYGSTVPNSSFVLPFGQALSRTTYAPLFSGVFGTAYGAGDGSTTFNIPDLRGRVVAGADDMGGTHANRLTSSWFGAPAVLGAAGGGSDNRTLVTANLPAYTPAGLVSALSTTTNIVRSSNITTFANGNGAIFQAFVNGAVVAEQIGTLGSLSGTAQGGTSAGFGVVQPTFICNFIMRVL